MRREPMVLRDHRIGSTSGLDGRETVIGVQKKRVIWPDYIVEYGLDNEIIVCRREVASDTLCKKLGPIRTSVEVAEELQHSSLRLGAVSHRELLALRIEIVDRSNPIVLLGNGRAARLALYLCFEDRRIANTRQDSAHTCLVGRRSDVCLRSSHVGLRYRTRGRER
jgi:hypothetical protein